MKEKTTHTTPNKFRVKNGIQVRSIDRLIEGLIEHRKEYDVITNTEENKEATECVLRLRCTNCDKNYKVSYKTYRDIPDKDVLCKECGSTILKYLD